MILQLYTPRVKNARIIWEKLEEYPNCKADFHFDGEAIIYFPLGGAGYCWSGIIPKS